MRRLVGLFLIVVSAVLPAHAGQKVSIPTAMGTSLDGYIAGPDASPLGVLILHDRWGLNDTIRGWVERYAEMGYRTLAIDVFDGRQSNKRWLADEILLATDPEAVKVNIVAGVRYLKAPGRKIVTVGAGFGGWQSYQVALKVPDEVAGTVVAYGPLELSVEKARTLKAPVLALFARSDERITADEVGRYAEMMKKSFITYRPQWLDAGHGFLDPLYPTYNEAAAADAWREIDHFLSSLTQ